MLIERIFLIVLSALSLPALEIELEQPWRMDTTAVAADPGPLLGRKVTGVITIDKITVVDNGIHIDGLHPGSARQLIDFIIQAEIEDPPVEPVSQQNAPTLWFIKCLSDNAVVGSIAMINAKHGLLQVYRDNDPVVYYIGALE